MNKHPEITAQTKKNIRDAFWSLYKEKTIDKISVAEIMKITGNNRGTFYHYYKDVYDVLEQIEKELSDDILREVIEALNNFPLDEAKRDIQSLFVVSVPIFKKHAEKLFTLLGKNGDPHFMNEFRKRIRLILIDFWILPAESEYLDYLMEYSYSAMFGLMTKWYENGNDLTDTEFFKMAQGLVANGVLGYLKQ